MDNNADSTFGTGENPQDNPCVSATDTTDKVFLLSRQEATDSGYGFAAYDQFGTDSTRIRVTTDYAKATGAYQSSTEGCGGWWWLRSPTAAASTMRASSTTVATPMTTTTSASPVGGVVPALCVQLPTNN